ncbi:MerR family transcriptional regulator [Streptomyces hygroscopicus subsp. sporocinereus]|uniref:MerR family transcriptional regulator n=2 Tax=Streptomyces hygroscopicus TaxID=1912 RepID=A0ABQ3TVU6_STRHY|nr:MerR family transcriptional regulator [Streptomyces hygroscopicus]
MQVTAFWRLRPKIEGMRIGEAAQRTGTTPRLLRYYEQQGLIAPGRSENGYREYDENALGRIAQIRDLLRAGLPTRLIQQVLPCISTPHSSIRFSGLTPEMVALLEAEQARLTARIDCLTRNRDAIADYLAALRETNGQQEHAPARTADVSA